MLKMENDIIFIELPQGKTQMELIKDLDSEFENIEKNCYGKEIKINGRCTTGMALYLGHKLAHVCKSVSIFDPKENAYVLSVWH